MKILNAFIIYLGRQTHGQDIGLFFLMQHGKKTKSTFTVKLRAESTLEMLHPERQFLFLSFFLSLSPSLCDPIQIKYKIEKLTMYTA
jgi:hypothetical protein